MPYMNDEARLALSEPETFQDQKAVHQIFTELRREDPVAWCPEPDGGKGYSVDFEESEGF